MIKYARGSDNMYVLTKDIIPGCVVWADKKVFYDRPGEKIEPKRTMFLITTVNEEFLLGCPLSKSQSTRNRTILFKEFYPIKYNSRVTEDLYLLARDDVYTGRHFVIKDTTFEHFKRSLYQRIAVDKMISPEEYSEIFVEDYLREHYPKKDSLVVYPSDDKMFKYYYIYNEDENNFFGIKLNRIGYDNYYVIDPKVETISKQIRFYDYYEKSPISRLEVEKSLVKKLY